MNTADGIIDLQIQRQIEKNIRITMYQKFKHWESLIFWALIFIHLIPLWSVSYFPTQDGPVHHENAVILSEYTNPEAGILREYYVINKQDLSNWLIQLLLSALTIISPLLVAEKILISGYIILFPVSVRYCLKAANPDSAYFSFFAFPFIYNYTLHMGFYGFCYSLVMVYTAIGILIILFYLYDLKSNKKNNLKIRLKNQLLTLFLTALPTLILMFAFLSRQGLGIKYSSTFTDRLIQLGGLTSLYSYIRTELWFAGIIVLILFFLSVSLLFNKFRNKQNDPYDMLLFVLAIYLGIYFLAPDEIANGTIINARLMLYCYFIVILWLGTQILTKTVKHMIIFASICISMFISGLNFTTYAEINSKIKEFVAPSELIRANSVLLPLSFYETKPSSPQSLPAYRVNPFMHLSSLIAANKRIVGLGNYQAWKGYFPIQAPTGRRICADL